MKQNTDTRLRRQVLPLWTKMIHVSNQTAERQTSVVSIDTAHLKIRERSTYNATGTLVGL